MSESTAVVVVLLLTVLLLNTVAFRAWRQDLLPRWYSSAVATALLALLVGDDFSEALAVLGTASLAALAALGAVAWWNARSKSHDPHRPER